MIENVYNGDGMTTALSLVWAMCQTEPMEFVADMQTRLLGAGSLSVAQVRGIWNVIRATEQREQEARVHAYVNYGHPPRFAGIASLMASFAEQMERPKLALPREDDESVWLSIAGKSARFPGSINVTDSRRFGGNWHGRIVDGAPDAQLTRDIAVMAALDTLEADPSLGNAVASHARGFAEECHMLVARDATLTVTALTNLLMRAFFCPSDDRDADSHETQSMRFEEQVTGWALDMLSSEDEALITELTSALERTAWRLRGRGASARIDRNGAVRVRLGRKPDSA